jgi:starch-binding outer membrane protein, SusD/RagB family
MKRACLHKASKLNKIPACGVHMTLMKKNKNYHMKVFKYLFGLLILSGIFFVSCIDTDNMEVLDESNHFRNIADVQKSIIGLYSKVMETAEQTVILNELRADMMDVTSNANQELQGISYFTSNAENTWVNPVPFYSVIQNCNDMLYHFDIMLANNDFTKDEYNEFYSDVMTVRCWTYLQIGTLFGKIPYLTEPIKSLNDLNVDESQYINLDQLIPKLIASMEALPTLNQYTAISGMLDKTLNTHNLNYYYINKRCLLTELYLWDDQYLMAAKTFRDFHVNGGTETAWKRYKTISYVYQGSFEGAFMVTYTRYLWNDFNSLINVWLNMFSLGMEEQWANYENITCMTFDKNFTPIYPFIRLTGTEGAGQYLVKPSANAIDNYWGVQVQNNGFTFDGRGEGGSYVTDDQSRPVITKYTHDFDINAPYEQAGKWFIYRAGWLNLLYAEACNRYADQGGYVDGDTLKPYSGFRRLTKAFLNTGLSTEFAFTKANGNSYPTDSVAISGWNGGNYFPYPFDFDARYSSVPYVRGYWRDHSGIRNRASLTAKTYDPAATTLSEVRFYEKAILDELALETAFEGHRWRDILRIARRWNREQAGSGTALLNEVIGAKFAKNGKTAPVFADDESNWYLPVKFK